MAEYNSQYFPPLDQCLEGGVLLIPWKLVFTGLSAPDLAHRCGIALERFLSDKHASRLLAQPFDAFQAPSAQTRTQFINATAAIHVTPSSKWKDDVEQIKADTLWLSETAKMDEFSALRIAVLEWQNRPAKQLWCGHPSEHLAGAWTAVNGNATKFSVFAPTSSTAPAFNSQSSRRTRLVKLYFSERRHFMKASEIILRAGLSDPYRSDKTSGGSTQIADYWVGVIGKKILHARCPSHKSSSGKESFVMECINALQVRAAELSRGGDAFASEEGQAEELELDRRRCVMLEMIHIMQLMFYLVDVMDGLLSSSPVLAWLRFMNTYRFFDGTELAEELSVSLSALFPAFQALISIISLTMLKLPNAIRTLIEDTEKPNQDSGAVIGPYMHDEACMSEMHSIIMDAVVVNGPVASLIVFAWGLILQTLREEVSSKKEARELRQSQHVVDGFIESDTSATEEGEPSVTADASGQSNIRPTTAEEHHYGRNVYDQILATVMDSSTTAITDPIEHLAMNAANASHVYDVILGLSTEYCKLVGSTHHGDTVKRMRSVLLDLIRYSLGWVQYSPEVMAAVLGVLTGGEHSWLLSTRPFDARPFPATSLDLASSFQDDDMLLVPKVLHTATARFPLEAVPFLKLVKALASSSRVGPRGKPVAMGLIENLHSLTQVLPEDFASYDTTREEENLNLILLRSEINIFRDRVRMRSISGRFASQLALVSTHNGGTGDGLTIPAGTEGRVLSEASPVVVQWMYPYSGLQYLGRLLESATPNGAFVDGLEHADSQSDIIAEVIGLLAALLELMVKTADSGDDVVVRADAAHDLLGGASNGLGRNADVVTLILDHFEMRIQEPTEPSTLASSMELLANCTHFLFALTKVLPGRVWPFFVRSGLLGTDGNSGRLIDLVAGAEIATGRYEVLIGCIRVFDALVDEAIDHIVARKHSAQVKPGPLMRESLGTGVSEQVMTKVILTFVRTLVDVFRSYQNWKFIVLEDRLEVGTRILTLFNKILVHAYSIEDSPDPSRKIVGMLGAAAQYLIDAFILPSSSLLPINSLLQVLITGIDTPQSTLFFDTTWSWARQVLGTLDFCNTLIHVNTLTKLGCSPLEKRLFEALPLLVRVFTSFPSYKLPVVKLLEAMVVGAASADGEPPSLLGHLGSELAQDFITLLTQFSKPLEDKELDLAIWRLMSAIICNRQSWFAICLLTGDTPRNTLKHSHDRNREGGEMVRGKQMLVEALDQLADISIIPRWKALALLGFVLCSVDHWPWSVSTIRKHDKFLTSILDFQGDLQKMVNVDNPSKGEESCSALRMASLVSEILAVYTYHSQRLGDRSIIQRLIPKLSYLVDSAVVVRGYNESLHANLKKNFEGRFPGYSLSLFRCTRLQPAEFGRGYYYNLDLANRMLKYDKMWQGTRGNGLADELARANVNLSLIEAQVLLLQSWKVLILELSRNLRSEPSLQQAVAKVVRGCLESNQNKNLPEDMFNGLLQIRGDLAFVLMQTLAEVGSSVPEMKPILFTAWATIRHSDVNFELALASGDVEYYRSLLKILFLSLRPLLTQPVPVVSQSGRQRQRQAPPSLSDLQPVIMEILDLVVARGFRHLTVAVHENAHRSSPEDIVLVTAILQTSLRIPGVEETMQGSICSRFTDEETARVAMTLFSWADQLAIDGDPIYGELAILFLVELSCMPLMAEQLALEGVLSQISNANLTDLLRRGVSPLDRRASRLYTIWTRGFVPLCLNMLQAIGPPIAPEVSAFLGQFEQQLAMASANFDTQPLLPVSTSSSSSSLLSTTSVRRPENPLYSQRLFTLAMVTEAHSLALIYRIIHTFRLAGPATGLVSSELPGDLLPGYDVVAVADDITYWLTRRAALRDRLMPIGPLEEEMARQRPSMGQSSANKDISFIGGGAHAVTSTYDDRFEEKVVTELAAVVNLLKFSTSDPAVVTTTTTTATATTASSFTGGGGG